MVERFRAHYFGILEMATVGREIVNTISDNAKGSNARIITAARGRVIGCQPIQRNYDAIVALWTKHKP